MGPRPRRSPSPQWVSPSLSDTEPGGVSLGGVLLDDDDHEDNGNDGADSSVPEDNADRATDLPPRAPVTPPASAGGSRVRTLPAPPPPPAPALSEPLNSLLPRTSQALSSPPLDPFTSPPSPLQTFSPRVARRRPRRPDRELFVSVTSSSEQLQSAYLPLPASILRDSSPNLLDSSSNTLNAHLASAAPITPPRRTLHRPPTHLPPDRPPPSHPESLLEEPARRSAGSVEQSTGTSGGQSASTVTPTSQQDSSTPWSNSTVRPGRSFARAGSPTPTRLASRPYATDTEDESDGGIAFDSDMDREYEPFSATRRSPAWAIAAEMDEDEDDDRLEAYASYPSAETDAPIPSESQRSTLRPYAPESPRRLGGHSLSYSPLLRERVEDSSSFVHGEGPDSVDDTHFVDLTNMDDDYMNSVSLGYVEEEPFLERNDAEDYGPEDSGDLEYGLPDENAPPTPGWTPADTQELPDDDDLGLDFGTDPDTTTAPYASVIFPAAGGEVLPIANTPFPVLPGIIHTPHQFDVLFSTVLDGGLHAVMAGQIMTPFTTGIDNNLNDLFNPTNMLVQEDFYRQDFEQMFKNLFRLNYAEPTSVRPPGIPWVSHNADSLDTTSQHRAEEYPDPEAWPKRHFPDIDQGIDWDALGITDKVARKYRRRTFRNYRNVRSAEKVSLSEIENTSHFLRFLRISTKHTPKVLHFQLRNILTVTSRNDIFYSTGTTVMGHHPYTHSQHPVMDLSSDAHGDSIRISSLASYHSPSTTTSLLIAGGFSGTYALRNLLSPLSSPITTGTITTDENGITNHIHITPSRTSSSPLAIFCSNDNHIRTLDTSTLTFLSHHPFPFAVNCAATSPDSRLRAVVGDSTDILIASTDSGRTELRLPHCHNDFSFAVDWAPDGITIATGNQDQTVRVFDVRNFTRPVRAIPMLMAGCRNLKFSPEGAGRPLLAIAEPSDYVHVLDCGRWEAEAQTMEFWGEVAGMEWTRDGGELVVGNADRLVGGVMAWERTGEGWGGRKRWRGEKEEVWEWRRPWRRRKRLLERGEDVAYV
ncbi:hypothetical protein EX30DRAFT_330678 [Ascodesmis nigricans]|uniref:Uncharacterized protein n=1 Tax=Ascodesmis nigricans TaxID=341454 RepID=A0A4S2MZ56_9PEZI|nr:hypothetical protein EX30DRAFT_330678 [Ascodesmis nigricans]